MQYILVYRTQIEVNNDPQRRCYNGAHFSTEKAWTPWAVLGYPASKEEGDARISGWQRWNAELSHANKVPIVREYKLLPSSEV